MVAAAWRYVLTGLLHGLRNNEWLLVDAATAKRALALGYARCIAPRAGSVMSAASSAKKARVQITPAGVLACQRANKADSPVFYPTSKGAAPKPIQAALWTACRIRKTFTYNELLEIIIDGSATKREIEWQKRHAKSYFASLRARALLQRLRIANDGVIYTLKHDLGPIAPQFSKRAVWNPNANQFWWEVNHE